ncbi:MAG: hypothetical protein LBC21_03580, partial [Oscillospiraceae bacterium]|nr:hypothetical protein [Oscillospiraceae bacterium]
MRRFPIFLIVFSVLAAAAGFFIRGAELRSAFDPISGLAIPGAGATGLLIALTAAVAAAAAAAGIMISARFELPNDVGGDVPEGTQSPEGTALSDGTAPEVAADAGGEPGAS